MTWRIPISRERARDMLHDIRAGLGSGRYRDFYFDRDGKRGVPDEWIDALDKAAECLSHFLNRNVILVSTHKRRMKKIKQRKRK